MDLQNNNGQATGLSLLGGRGVHDFSVDIDNLEVRVETAETNISSNDGELSNHQGRITALEGYAGDGNHEYSHLVHTTGDQTINGFKTFTSDVIVGLEGQGSVECGDILLNGTFTGYLQAELDNHDGRIADLEDVAGAGNHVDSHLVHTDGNQTITGSKTFEPSPTGTHISIGNGISGNGSIALLEDVVNGQHPVITTSGNVSGARLSYQEGGTGLPVDVNTQINGKVSKTGDTMTGALNLRADTNGDYLRFNGERSWLWYAGSSGQTTDLRLKDEGNGKEWKYFTQNNTEWARWLFNNNLTGCKLEFLYGSLIMNNDTEIYYKTQTLDDRFVKVTGDTMTGTLTVPKIQMTNAQNTSKICLWSDSTRYSIGMTTNGSSKFGGLYWNVMYFTMDAGIDSGFLWRGSGHAQDGSEGAMSLSTDGRLTVANNTRIGYGETTTTDPTSSIMLDVNGDTNINGNLTIDGGSLYSKRPSGGTTNGFDLLVTDNYGRIEMYGTIGSYIDLRSGTPIDNYNLRMISWGSHSQILSTRRLDIQAEGGNDIRLLSDTEITGDLSVSGDLSVGVENGTLIDVAINGAIGITGGSGSGILIGNGGQITTPTIFTNTITSNPLVSPNAVGITSDTNITGNLSVSGNSTVRGAIYNSMSGFLGVRPSIHLLKTAGQGGGIVMKATYNESDSGGVNADPKLDFYTQRQGTDTLRMTLSEDGLALTNNLEVVGSFDKQAIGSGSQTYHITQTYSHTIFNVDVNSIAYKIAELPVSSGSTKDYVRIRATAGYWSASQTETRLMRMDITLRAREGYGWDWNAEGFDGVLDKVVFYAKRNLATGSKTEIWVQLVQGYYMVKYDIEAVGGAEIITSPTAGTLPTTINYATTFVSSNTTTYRSKLRHVGDMTVNGTIKKTSDIPLITQVHSFTQIDLNPLNQNTWLSHAPNYDSNAGNSVRGMKAVGNIVPYAIAVGTDNDTEVDTDFIFQIRAAYTTNNVLDTSTTALCGTATIDNLNKNISKRSLFTSVQTIADDNMWGIHVSSMNPDGYVGEIVVKVYFYQV